MLTSHIRAAGRAEPATAARATRRGGACRPCRSSTPTTRRCASTCWRVAEHWLRFGIDGWRLDVPAEIDDPPFWAAFRQRCRAVTPDAYLVGEIWHVAPEWVAGDRFDALMNYPLAEAILGFVGRRQPRHGVARAPITSTASTCIRSTGRRSRQRLAELLRRLRPGRRRGPAQPAGLPRRPAGADGPRRRPRRAADGDRCSRHAARCAVHLLRRRGRPDAAGTIRPTAAPSRGTSARWDGELRAFVAAVLRLRAADPAIRHGATASPARCGPALAFERRLDDRRLVVAVNAGDDLSTSS